jgi:hypothetical protein
MTIPPVGASYSMRTDGHDEADSFFAILRKHLKTNTCGSIPFEGEVTLLKMSIPTVALTQPPTEWAHTAL